MSARLDDDVLFLILEEAAGPPSTVGNGGSRQDTLGSISLASRRLRRLAQPLWWAQVHIERAQQVARLRAVALETGLGRHTTHYKAQPAYKTTMPVDEAAAVSGVLPNIQEIALASALFQEQLSLASLEMHTNLRRLSLDVLNLSHSAAPPTLPQLDELSVFCCSIEESTVREWLQSARLPRLRVLAVGGGSIRADMLSAGFLAQLDLVQADTQSFNPANIPAQTSYPLILVEDDYIPAVLTRYSILSTPAHMDESMTHNYLDHLAPVVARVPEEPDTPYVVGLPRSILRLATVSPDVWMRRPPGVTEAFAERWRAFEEQCRHKHVRIILFDEDARDASFGFVPREFLRYARELKAAKRLETAREAR